MGGSGGVAVVALESARAGGSNGGGFVLVVAVLSELWSFFEGVVGQDFFFTLFFFVRV
jgi:hypothetical protein